ncbi:hypothetical protein BDZ89DRAFT_1113096 [Hymenopellis radicata]|nr:hypothetical protein BDZ89DRAFT_1113096 [Hymenopellis radicata]
MREKTTYLGTVATAANGLYVPGALRKMICSSLCSLHGWKLDERLDAPLLTKTPSHLHGGQGTLGYSGIPFTISLVTIPALKPSLLGILKRVEVPRLSEVLKGVVRRMGPPRHHLEWAAPRLPAYDAARKAGVQHLVDFLWTEWKRFYAEFADELMVADTTDLNSHIVWRAYGMRTLNTIMQAARLISYFLVVPKGTPVASSAKVSTTASAPKASTTASAPKASTTASAPKASTTASALKASTSDSAPKASTSASSLARPHYLPERARPKLFHPIRIHIPSGGPVAPSTRLFPPSSSVASARPTLRPAQFDDASLPSSNFATSSTRSTLPCATADQSSPTPLDDFIAHAKACSEARAVEKASMVKYHETLMAGKPSVPQKAGKLGPALETDTSCTDASHPRPDASRPRLSRNHAIANLGSPIQFKQTGILLPECYPITPINSSPAPLVSPFGSPIREKSPTFTPVNRSPVSSPLSSPIIAQSPGISTVLNEATTLLNNAATFIEDTRDLVATIDSTLSRSSSPIPSGHIMVTRHRGKTSGAGSTRASILAAASKDRIAREAAKRKTPADDV